MLILTPSICVTINNYYIPTLVRCWGYFREERGLLKNGLGSRRVYRWFTWVRRGVGGVAGPF